jgi:nucleoid-associated protein EbfC
MSLANLKQARELKAKLDKIQKDLANVTVEASTGKGGAVKVTADGKQRITSIEISPEVINPEKPQALAELIMRAVNDVLEKSQKAAAKELKEITGGFKIPGL